MDHTALVTADTGFALQLFNFLGGFLVCRNDRILDDLRVLFLILGFLRVVQESDFVIHAVVEDADQFVIIHFGCETADVFQGVSELGIGHGDTFFRLFFGVGDRLIDITANILQEDKIIIQGFLVIEIVFRKVRYEIARQFVFREQQRVLAVDQVDQTLVHTVFNDFIVILLTVGKLAEIECFQLLESIQAVLVVFLVVFPFCAVFDRAQCHFRLGQSQSLVVDDIEVHVHVVFLDRILEVLIQESFEFRIVLGILGVLIARCPFFQRRKVSLPVFRLFRCLRLALATCQKQNSKKQD